MRAAPAPLEGTCRSADGTSLFLRRWPAERPALGLLLVHGLGDHGDLHPTVAALAAARRWHLVAPDLRGHGRSPGRRGHVRRFADLVADARAGLDTLAAEVPPPTPLAVLGASLGGLVALHLALAQPVRLGRAVLAAPPLGPIATHPLLLLLARLVSPVWPAFSLDTGLDLATLADDSAVRRALLDDPLFHRRASARLGVEVEEAIAAAHARAAELALPTLIVHGSGDGVVPIEGSRRFAAGPAAGRVRLVEVPGGRHAVLADTGYQRVLDEIARFLEDAAPA